MNDEREPDPKAELARLCRRLVEWLVDSAYPTWARLGIDSENGGFAEALGQNGVALSQPRRARVHPRQIHAFAHARSFGWRGDVAGIVSRGIEYFITHYRRSDGFFRTLTSAGGSPLDDRALLYDQAFALLGYAAAAKILDSRSEYERRALELRRLIESRWRTADGAFLSGDTDGGYRESNPHMHLLEACLAWTEIGSDPDWDSWARALVELALSRFIREDTGALGEAYTPTWQPASGLFGRIVEPGHQFEWAWLLLRRENRHPRPLRPAALRLMAIGEDFGVRNNVAVNALLDDLTVQDPNARLWPQTERLKAAVLAAKLCGEPRFWSMAHAAALSLLPYLDTPLPGLWFDMQRPSGELIYSPAPASTLYHLVGAVAELNVALRSAA
jgi:mannose/cellobiose epimerase-like protein (N-acyl-D-glucosamine 2-epimerase family)